MNDEGQALNRRIAERLGWHTEVTLVQSAGETRQFGKVLIDPSGEVYWTPRPTEDDNVVWQHAPDYCHSLDAVVAALAANCGVEISLWWDGKFDAVIRDYARKGNMNSRAYAGLGATRQEAAARALLAYLESEG